MMLFGVISEGEADHTPPFPLAPSLTKRPTDSPIISRSTRVNLWDPIGQQYFTSECHIKLRKEDVGQRTQTPASRPRIRG